MKLGVISDTHNFFDPQLPALFWGVEHLLHAGDVGAPRLLSALRQVAPVTAVAGNTDDPGLCYPLTQVLTLAGRRFLLHHIVKPHEPSESLKELLARERPNMVVFGHTHKPFDEVINGTRFFNPGYAGKSRFGMPRSVAILHCGKSIEAEFLWL